MISRSELDEILTLQLAVAWAGEAGEEPRLAWWRSDLTSEFGGQDLFQRLLPRTWRWATFQAAREAARRKDAEVRGKDHDPDRIISLFRFGFEVDERLDERFLELKGSGNAPLDALPGLKDVVSDEWRQERFSAWAGAQGAAEVAKAPVGRRLKDEPLDSFKLKAHKLVAALVPLGSEYPLPHFRRNP